MLSTSRVLPIEGQIHTKDLSFVRNIIDEEENSPPSEYMCDIVIQQLAMKEDEFSSWATMVKNSSQHTGSPVCTRSLKTPLTKDSGRRFYTKQYGAIGKNYLRRRPTGCPLSSIKSCFIVTSSRSTV